MSIQLKASKQKKSLGTRALAWAAGVSGLAVVLAAAAPAQTTPNAIVTQTKTLVSINGNAGHIAANSAGDVFYVSQADNIAYWLKRGSTTPIAILSGLSGGRSIYVDASNNVYIPSNYSGTISEIPFVNGTYATGSARASLTACSSATPTSPCNQFGNGGAGVSYYYQATDLGFDGSGNAYVVDEYDNESPNGTGKNNAIEVFKYNGVSYAATVLINSLPQNNSAQIAVDTNGDVYYADGTNLYSVAKGASTVTSFGTGLSKPSGVAVDKYGNLFVTDSGNNRIYEFPALNGVAQTSNQIVFDPIYSANAVAFDGLGDMFYTGYSGGTNLNVARINSFPLGSSAVGTAVSATAATLTVTFIANETLGAPTLSGGNAGFTYTAGTCAAGTAYTAQQTCNINVNYTPNAVGLQTGAVILTNASGAVVATAELSGIGLGAAQTNDPGTPSAIGSGFTSPQGIAVDSTKNIYIANTGKNTVVEYAAGSPTAVTVGSGLVGPTSVAVDNAGNLFIADSGNGRVVEVPNVGGALATSAQSVVISGLGTSIGLATDPYGTLYVADSTNKKVLALGVINGAPSTSAQSTVTLPSTAVAPFALATDSTGDLFVADVTANTVTEVGYYGKQLTNIGTGYSHPSGLAVDAAGSLYVADPGNIRLIKIPFESPIYNTNDQYSVGPPFTVAAGVTIPYGVAIDSSANLYVLDNQDATVTFLNRTSGTLNLGTSNVNATTAQQNAYVADAGNQSLVLANPDYTIATPNTAFTVTSPSSNGCTNSETLLAGFSCVLQATFKPGAVGSYTETLAFNSNAANTSTPSLILSGQGLSVAATTLSLTQTSPQGTAAFGQVVTITATISSTTAGTPSGDVIFYVDGNFYSVVKVSGSSVSVQISGLLGGSHTIAASYTGDNTFASSNSTLTLIVAKAANTVTVTGTGGQVFQFPTSAVAGAPVTLTAQVTPNATTVPTGTVTFTAGSTTLGTASVVTQSGKYVASIVVTTLPAGTNTVVATYSGDVNYASSTGTLLVVISPQTFAITPTTQSVTVGKAATIAVPLQVASVSGFGNAFVSLTCTGLPANSVCGFNPNGFVLQPGNQLTAQQTNPTGTIILVPATYGPTNVSLNIQTGTTPVVAPPTLTGSIRVPGLRNQVPVSWAFLAMTPFTLLLRRRVKRLRAAIRLLSVLLLAGVSIGAFSGCGNTLVGVTPTGTYHITITATASDPSYPAATATAPLAPGCTITPSTATYPTCTQTAQITLVVQ